MKILESQWLIMMLEKSSDSPVLRILSLFDILNDWLQAPDITEQLQNSSLSKQAPAILHDYLTHQATLAKAALPEILAHQIYFMLSSAITEAIHSGQFNTFSQAKLAAKALISAQTDLSDEAIAPKPNVDAQRQIPPISRTNKTKVAYGFAITLTICILGFYIALNKQWIQQPSISALAHPEQKPSVKNVVASTSVAPNFTSSNTAELSPLQVSSLLGKVEQMRKGNCQLLEAIQIPDQHKDTYFKVVVEGEAPKDLRELEIANFYIQKVRCNYTPMLMSNSTN